jgi:protein-S-isoprenylcysteine O-methyltransferase Ste14
MNNSIKGWVLVLLQFICLGLLFIYPAKAQFRGPGLFLIISGVLLLAAAIIYMPAKNYTVHPKPTKFGRFTASGPYRLIRHPMYTSVIIIAIGVVSNHFDIIRCLILIVLIFTLITKINFEDSLLNEKYPEYDMYKLTTKKLIPFVW